MRIKTLFSVAVAVVFGLGLTACSSPNQNGDGTGNDVIAPVTMDVSELPGAEVTLLVDQVLNINVDPESVEAYTAEVSDTDIAEFTPGHTTDSAEFNPGVTALAPGSTEVTMSTTAGNAEPIEFVVIVSDK